MYESPVTLIEQMNRQINKEKEDYIHTQIVERLGVVVDKEELIKALQYDRDQYKKGFEDGKQKYKDAFEIACDLMAGGMYGPIDKDTIFEEVMEKQGCFACFDYEEYILEHLDELNAIRGKGKCNG